MMKVIADSTCNLSQETLDEFDIRIAPIPIQFGDETFEEGVDIDRDLFYKKIEETGVIPTSSQPTPAWFGRYYRELHQQGHSILVITVTGKHSGTFNSATMAKSLAPEADVQVFDSRSISLGTGWMVLEAVRAIKAGVAQADVLNRIEAIRERAKLFITPATLKYLQMSGRVGTLQGALASLLSVKPIIHLKDGLLEVSENVRTRGKALDQLIVRLEEAVGRTAPVNLAVIHARARAEGLALLDRAKDVFNVQETLFGDLVASLASHGGPGIIGLFAYQV
ncbi:MAG: DegV family protein [Anaerolineales bacterium]|nr:DegV family protein [Anaerolineales bacterium]MCK5633682.1 DegV family protein [Anaerolineales bacterium]